MTDWRDQEVRNETIFREMNEWTMEENLARTGTEGGTENFLCECSDRRCSDPIRLTRREYEDVRAVPIRFAIAVDHENPEIDRLLSENDRYSVVEKYQLQGMRIARETDPRR